MLMVAIRYMTYLGILLALHQIWCKKESKFIFFRKEKFSGWKTGRLLYMADV